MMTWARIRDSDGVWLEGPLDEEPVSAEGETVIVVAIGLGTLVEWSPTKRAFVDLVTPVTLISSMAFKLLLTPTERMQARALRASDPVIDDYFDLLDSATNGVALAHPMIGAGLDYLISLSPPVLTAERKARILAGLSPE